MSDGVSTLSSSVGVTPLVATGAPSATASSTTHTSTDVTPVSFQNPRVIQDPVAGYITEYLSANGGQILSQTPNAITVAYLRNGLTADGEPKHRATTA